MRVPYYNYMTERDFMRIKVVIVEDEKKTLSSLFSLLNSSESLEVVGSFASGEEAIKEVPRIQPNVVLIDLGLPGISGIEVIRELKDALPFLKMLVFTIREDKFHLFQALRAGSLGYLLKDASPGELIEAIEEINRDGSPMSPKIARYVIDYFQEQEGDHHTRISILSEREKEILRGIADGLTYKKLADKYFISPHTARTHIKHIYEKLHVHSRGEAVMKGKKEGVL